MAAAAALPAAFLRTYTLQPESLPPKNYRLPESLAHLNQSKPCSEGLETSLHSEKLNFTVLNVCNKRVWKKAFQGSLACLAARFLRHKKEETESGLLQGAPWQETKKAPLMFCRSTPQQIAGLQILMNSLLSTILLDKKCDVFFWKMKQMSSWFKLFKFNLSIFENIFFRKLSEWAM